jgi:hypothetical protein
MSSDHIRNISKSLLSAVNSVVTESIKGDQHKLDANKNGKVDAHDFQMLRNKKKKVTKEEVGNDEFCIESEDWGDGEIIEVNDDSVRVMFEHGEETVDLDLLDEVSQDTLKAYTSSAKADPSFKTAKGRVPAAKAKQKAKRQSGLEMAKSKLSAIYKKENAQHIAKMNTHVENLNNKFHKEAPAILKKHGYSKVADGDTHHTWVKPHEEGHTTSVTMSKTPRTNFGGGAEFSITNSKHNQNTPKTSHDSLWKDEHAEDAHKSMMPKFEAALIDHHEKHKNNW